MAKKRIYSEILKESAAAVHAILERIEPEIHQTEGIDPALLYRVDANTMHQLVQIGIAHDAKIEEAAKEDDSRGIGRSDPLKRFDFTHVVKLINPEQSVGTYSVHEEVRYKSVSDPAKVRARLEEEFSVWANAYRAHAAANSESGDRLEVLKKVDGNIANADTKLRRIIKNFDDYEVRIISKARANRYSTLSYTLVNEGGKRASQSRHLAIKTPNVIWFEPLRYRPNDTTTEFMRKAIDSENVFGDIYFLPKI